MTSEQQRFLDLRAKGKTYDEIAADLGVSRRTLYYWNKELHEEVCWEEAAEMECLHQELLGTREARVRRLAKRLAAIEEEIDKRSLAELSTAKLFSLADSFRRQLIKETSPSKPDRANVPPVLHSLGEGGVSRDQKLPLQSDDTESPVQSGGFRPINHQLTRPSTSSAPCNDSANAVQPELGRANLPVSRDQGPAAPIPEPRIPTIQALKVQTPSDSDWKADLSSTFDSALPAAKTPATLSTSPQCNDSAIAVHSAGIVPSPLIHQTKNPVIQRQRCEPISPERLIGPNINFREVLERRRRETANPASVQQAASP